MRRVFYRTHYRVATSARLHDRNMRVYNGAGITKQVMHPGCRQLRQNGVQNTFCILPSALGNLGLHSLGERVIL